MRDLHLVVYRYAPGSNFEKLYGRTVAIEIHRHECLHLPGNKTMYITSGPHDTVRLKRKT